MITQLDKIQPINRVFQGDRIDNSYGTDGNNGTFASVFQSAIDYVRETDADKNKAEYMLSTGQLDNPALLTIASTKNQIAVELLVQLRNKALDAYSELTRISL